MKNHLILYWLALVVIGARAPQPSEKKTATVIEGHFDDGRTDTVILRFFEKSLGQTMAGQQEQAFVTTNGHFLFRVPLKGETGYVTIVSKKKTALQLTDYLIKKGDSNYIRINTAVDKDRYIFQNGLVFSGRNCGSFATRYHIDSAYRESVRKAKHWTLSNDSLKKDIATLWQLFAGLDQSSGLRAEAIKAFKTGTLPAVMDILAMDYLYDLEFSKLSLMDVNWRATYRHPDSVGRREKMTKYFTEVLMPFEKNHPFPALARSVSKAYMSYQYLKQLMEVKIGEQQPMVSTALSLIPLIEKGDPVTREKQLTSLIAIMGGWQDLPGRDSLINYGLKHVQDAYLHGIITLYHDRTLKGRPAYVFRLEDPFRKMVSLAAFRGKTVVLDFWYTGCGACVQVGRELKKIRKDFDADTSVVFVSISTDKKREDWLESIREGIYTDENCVNLFTMGKGHYHEITDYYDITAYPRLMIIDRDGNLSAFNAIRPGTATMNAALVNQIRSAR